MTFVKINSLEVSLKGHMLYQFRKQEVFSLTDLHRSEQQQKNTLLFFFFFKAKTEALLDLFAHLEGNQSKAVPGGRTSVKLQVSSPFVTSESAGSLNRATLLQFIAEVSGRRAAAVRAAPPPACRCARNHLRLFPLCDQSGRWSMPNVLQAPTPRCLVAPEPPHPPLRPPTHLPWLSALM